MEECESLASDTTEFQEFQGEASETLSQDDEDEMEELQNSLREVVQDQSVKPRLQCLLMDPSFSMVTVQSEDSGIVWETASSRCSTPWASEASSVSEAYSMEGSGAAGKITIIFDEEKVIRRRVRSGGRCSRLGDRLSRPGSSRSASALGVERPEMAEVSIPNVKQEKKETEPDLTETKNKDQQLFSLISEGYEILNIRVPSKLPTVDEEESTELQDNLSYLDQTPLIKSQNHHGWTWQQNHVLQEEQEIQDHQEPTEQDSSTPSADTELRGTHTRRESPSDIDYFENFTLVDVMGSGEQAQVQQEETEHPAAKPKEEELKPSKNTSTDSLSASEDSFVFVEIVGEHLDEVFYGEGAPAEAQQRRGDDEAEDGAGRRMRRESQRSVKESGSVLFESEETILTPIFISPGPPKIIDPILLEEPTALSFMYSDLYEDAVGERRKSDEDNSEAESGTSEKSYKRRFSDSEEADGYLQKFTLKDEIPTLEGHSESLEERRDGRMMWSKRKFEMTRCLQRAVTEEEEKTKIEQPKTQETSVDNGGEDLKSVPFEGKRETDAGIEMEREEIKLSQVTVEQTVREASEESIQGWTLKDDKMGDTQVKRDINGDQTEPLERSIEETLPQQVDSKDGETEREETFTIKEPEQQVVVNASQETAVTATVSREEPHITEKSEIPTETNEKSLSEGAADIRIVSADQKVITEVIAEAPAGTAAETSAETSADTSLCEKKEAEEVVSEDVAPFEIITESVDQKVITEVKAEAPAETAAETCPCEKKEAEEVDVAPVEIITDSIDEKVITEVIAETPAETSGETAAEISTETSLCEKKEAEEVVSEDVAPVKVTTESVDQKVITEVKAEAPAETAAETLAETCLCEKKEAAEVVSEDVAPVEIITDSIDEKVITEVKAEAPAETSGETAAEISAETSLCEKKEAEEVVSEDVAPVKVTTDCDSVVHAVVEITEKAVDEKETQTQIQIDLQEVQSAETNKQTAAPEEERGSPTEETAVESQSREFLTEAEQESEVKTEISCEVIKPVMPEEVKTECKQQQEESVKDSESEKTTLTPKDKDKEKTPIKDTMDVGDELILLVPKGQAVEMDIEISPWSEEKTTNTVAFSEPDSTDQHLIASETTTKSPETPQKLKEETMAEPEVEITPEVVKEVVRNEIDNRYAPSPSTPVEEADTEDQRVEWDLDKNEGFFSPLRSFPPQHDLSGLHREDIQTEAAASEQKVEMHEVEDASPEPDLDREDVGQKMEQHEAGTEAPEVIIEELEYEVISEQDSKEMPEPKTQRDAGEPKPESGQEKEERMKMEVKMEEEDKVFDLSPEEEPIEADYEFIDAEEERQARLAAELEGLNWFCLTCGCLLSEDSCVTGEDHEVTAVDKAYEEIKEKISDWIAELQGRSENIEDLVSEIELAYNSIEDQCVEAEAAMQAQNEEMMALVMEQYNNMSISLEEEKKAKLEQLYDQIVSFQDSIDSAKATLETTAREAETDARSPEDIHSRLKEALDSVMLLELGPKGLLVFEDYAKGNTSSSHLAQRKGIPVPQRPTLQPQEPGSATSTSVTVYWKVNPGDIIDCFQVYCMEDPQGVSEEYRVTVKESHCVLEELEPDKTYKVWVMAVNYTGCSLPSQRLTFRTAPSVPVINTEHCTVMGDSATLRWSSTKKSSKQSYTLEYCRQYELEGEGLRSISGIKSCEQNVLLQPDENYLFYIKAVNEAGPSEPSEAALISTKGTRFHLLKASAHPALELSEDLTTLRYSYDASENTPSTDKQCPSILGELLLPQGHYYWETIVSGSTAYRLGVAYSTANRHSPLGENNLSWCLQCIPMPSGCRYQLLHNDIQSSLVVTEMPERVGTLLDYQLGHLSFYNAQSGQLLGTFCQRFTKPCHPALALELPGSLEVRMLPEAPEFTKDS